MTPTKRSSRESGDVNAGGRIRRNLMTGLAILAGVGAAGFAGAHAGLFTGMENTYLRWALDSRIDGLAQARIAGDLNEARRFVIESCEPRAPLGGAVRYFRFDVKDVDIEDSVANVKVGVSYKVALPGFSSESDPPRYTDMYQRWVRVGWTWYWDPGPVRTAGRGVRFPPAYAAAPGDHDGAGGNGAKGRTHVAPRD